MGVSYNLPVRWNHYVSLQLLEGQGAVVGKSSACRPHVVRKSSFSPFEPSDRGVTGFRAHPMMGLDSYLNSLINRIKELDHI